MTESASAALMPATAPPSRRRAALSFAPALGVAAAALGWWLLGPSGSGSIVPPFIAVAALVWIAARGALLAASAQRALRDSEERARSRAVELQRALDELTRVEAERQRALEVRAAALNRYELLARHSRDIVLLLRAEDGRILEANAAAIAAYGYPRDELLGLTIRDLRSDDPRLVARQLAEADARGLLFETVHRRKDGSAFAVEVSSQGATIDGNRMLISIIRDITERKRAEEALRTSEERLRAVFDHAAVGIVEANAELRFVAANAWAYAILGRRPDELLGRTVQELTAPEDRARSATMNARLASGAQGVMEYEKRYLKPDGTRVWVHMTVSAIRDAAGKLVRAVGTMEDITERKAAEGDRERLLEALREADRKKDEFLGVLSHELRNPLAPIRNAVHLLKHLDLSSPQALRARDVIDRQTSHMTRLVDDLLDVTRIARGKIELRPERVDLSEIVRSTGEDHRSLMTGRGVAFEVDVPQARAWARGDRTRLEQIVGNLLQNAAKFTDPGGRVTLSLRRRDERAEIAVRDTGVGIDPALVSRVFDPFVQAEHSLARSGGGLGLGLALVKGLAELHGGSVTARSDGPGQGSEFLVDLPLLAPPPA